jgi:hypothetical protein
VFCTSHGCAGAVERAAAVYALPNKRRESAEIVSFPTRATREAKAMVLTKKERERLDDSTKCGVSDECAVAHRQATLKTSERLCGQSYKTVGRTFGRVDADDAPPLA